MNKELQNQISRLKNAKMAQPFFLRTPQEQAILKKAGRTKVFYPAHPHDWVLPQKEPVEWECESLILQHDYQLEPEPKSEYIDIEIEKVGEWIELETPMPRCQSRLLDIVIRSSRLVGFVSDSDWVRLEEIATRIHKGHKVIARFRRE